MTRRDLLEAMLAMMVAPSVTLGAPKAGSVPRRRLGRTGVEVSCLGLGGAHIGDQPTAAQSVRLIRRAIDAGITFLDNCWDYHGGQSELRMGKALEDGYRDRVFLMTKFDGRDRKTARSQLEQSLKRLRTDYVDLWQLHEVIHPGDAERVFRKGGAAEAMLEAQREGKTRFVGFTGHKSPDYHLEMLEAARRHGFRFDAVQLPLNVMDAHFDSFEKRVLPVLLREGIGVLGMKPMGAGIFLETGVITAPECLRYSLSLSADVVITGMDTAERVDQALGVAQGFAPLTAKQKASLLARTAGAARAGHYEKYKTTLLFDGTTRHPEWMG